MGTKTPTKTYQVIENGEGGCVDVTISEPPTGPILGLSTWSSSLVIANQFHALRHLITIPQHTKQLENGFHESPSGPGIKAPRVLEIGAGTGLAGLAAALIWKVDVVLSDIPDCVENVTNSIAMNANALAEAQVIVQPAALDWKYPSELTLNGKTETSPKAFGTFDIIISADTVYDEDHPEMIMDVLELWLSPHQDAKFIVGYPLRIMHLEWIRDLWTRLESFGLHVVKEAQVNIGEEWDDERLLEWSVWIWKVNHD